MKLRNALLLFTCCTLLLGNFASAFAAGLPTFVDPDKDLAARPETFPSDSWFFWGRLKAENGDVYFYTLHEMTIDKTVDKDRKIQFAQRQFSLANVTKGWHKGNQEVWPLSQVSVSKTGLDFKMPDSSISGDRHQMKIKSTTSKGAFDLTVNPKGPVLYYNGGHFPWLGAYVWEFGMPKAQTTGTITVDGKVLKVSGTSWFDRQWDDITPVMLTNGFKWTWVAINLDNSGDIIAVWDIQHEGKGNTFATILSPSGATTTVDVVPLAQDATNVWESPESGRKYPNRWLVKIPALNTSLEVTTTKPGQEILSAIACRRPEGCRNPANGLQHTYESAATVKGVYKGKKTTGYSQVEMVGGW